LLPPELLPLLLLLLLVDMDEAMAAAVIAFASFGLCMIVSGQAFGFGIGRCGVWCGITGTDYNNEPNLQT